MPPDKKTRVIRSIVDTVIESEGIKRYKGSGRPFETVEDREIFQHYGYTSRPQKGAEAILFLEDNKVYSLGEDDRRYRIKITNGEVCIYTDEGDKIWFKRNNIIHIVSSNLLLQDIDNKVEINTKDKEENISNDRKVDIGNDDNINVKKKRTLKAKQIENEADLSIKDKAKTIRIEGIANVSIISDLNVNIISPALTITSGEITINGELLVNGNIHLSDSFTVQNENGDNLHQH